MNSNGKHGMKRILSMVLVVTMMMTIMPFIQQPVHAASTIGNTTVKDAVLNYLSGTLGGTPQDIEASLPRNDVLIINISNDKSVIGTLDLSQLKTDFPSLAMVNIQNTNITNVIGTGSGVTVGGSFADTNSSTARKLIPSSNSLTYNLETGTNGINLNDLVGALNVNSTDGTTASELISGIKECSIDGAIITPISGGSYGYISHSDLVIAGEGSRTLKLEFEFNNVASATPAWTYTVEYSLEIKDASLTITPDVLDLYQGSPFKLKVEKFNSDGNSIPVGNVGQNLTITRVGLSTANLNNTSLQGNALIINAGMLASETVGQHSVTVTDNLTGKTATAVINVKALPPVVIGLMDLIEVNGSYISSTPFNSLGTGKMYIKGGTSISSEDINNLTSAINPYTESTVYVLRDSSGNYIPDAYCSVLMVSDTNVNPNIVGEIISVDIGGIGYAAVRITANATDNVITGNFIITDTASIGLSTLPIPYSITASMPQAYKVYMIDGSVYSNPQTVDIHALINSTSDPAVQEIAEYTGSNGGGWNPLSGNTATMLEQNNAWFVVATQYGNGEPYFAVPFTSLTSWRELVNSTSYSEITTPPYIFTACSDISGETVNAGGGTTKSLIITPDLGSGGNKVTVLIQVSVGSGVSNTFELDIEVKARSVDHYEIRTASGTVPTASDLKVSIGTSKDYTVYVVYDNGYKEQVDFADTSLDITFSNAALFPASVNAATVSNGTEITVTATDDGGANDAIAGQTSKITVTDSAGKTGEATLEIDYSQVNGVTYYVETPSGIFEYGTNNEIKEIYSEKQLVNNFSGVLEIPRGLESNVWAVPKFTNKTIYNANDPADWKQYADTSGVTFSSFDSSGGLGLPSPAISGNVHVISADNDLMFDIDEPLSAIFEINGSVNVNGKPHSLYNNTAVQNNFTVKITDPIVVKAEPEVWDESIGDYIPLTLVSGSYPLSGKVGDEIKLRLRVTYSDGTAVDAIGNNTASTYSDGVYFLPSDDITYDPAAGYITSPADTSVPDFGAGDIDSLGVIHGYFMSHYPKGYSDLVNPLSGIPSAGDWNYNRSSADVQRILSDLTKEIGIHAYEGSTATTKITAGYLMKSNDVVPGHFVIKLTQSGTYTVDFSGTYTANGFNKKIRIDDAIIDLTISSPVIEKIYLVSDELSYVSTTLGTDLYKFDVSNSKKFNVYPIFVDSSYRLTADYAAHGFPAYLPSTSSAGTVPGVNKVKATDWVSGAIGPLVSGNLAVLNVVEKTDGDGYIYFEVEVLPLAPILVTSPENLSLSLSLSLGQISTPSGPEYDISTLPSNPNDMDIYTITDPLLQDIRVKSGYTTASGTSAATSVELGQPIYFPVEYLLNDSSAYRKLLPSEYPLSPGTTNVLVVKPDAANPGPCSVAIDPITGDLKFVAAALGQYTFYLSSTNRLGAPIPAASQLRSITFTVEIPNYEYDVFYGESVAISPLPSGYATIQEVGGTSYLDANALASGRLKMVTNQDATALIEIRSASGAILANVQAYLYECDTVISVTPAALGDSSQWYEFADGESIKAQWKTEYTKPGASTVTLIEYSDISAITHMVGSDDFITFSNSILTANANGATTLLFGMYQATDSTGTVHILYAKLNPAAPLPQYSYVLHDGIGGNPVTSPLSIVRGQVKNIYVYDTINNVYVNNFTVSSSSGNAAVTNLGGYARIEGVSAGTATITFAPLLGGAPVTLAVTVFENVPQTYTVTGQITGSDTNAGIPNASVTLDDLSGNVITVTADSNGYYTAAGVLDGSYTLTASATGYITATRITPVAVNGSNVSNEDFELNPVSPATYKIEGTVTDSSTTLGIPGATVELSDASGVIATVQTLSDGSYIFTAVGGGNYTVEASALGYMTDSIPVTVAGADETGVDIALNPVTTPTFIVDGTITDSASGLRIIGAVVTIVDDSDPSATFSTTTNSHGYYIFPTVPDGTYTIKVSKSGYTTKTESVTVNNGDETVNIALTATVTPPTPPTPTPSASITITPNVITLGSSAAAKVTASNFGSGVRYQWSSSNPAVATVSGSTSTVSVVAVGYGTATISCRIYDGVNSITVSATIQVTYTPDGGIIGGGYFPVSPVIPGYAAYTVTFDSKGGSSVENITGVSYGSKITAPASPVREGYTFTGWYTESTCETKWNFSKDTVTKDITLYAGWEKEASTSKSYTVTFESNGGSRVEPITNISYGSTISAPTEPTRKGYDFAGWYTEPVYQNKWDFSKNTVTENRTLYASWTKAASAETHSAYIFGYGNGKFGPNDTITRAQAVQIFYNLLKDKGTARGTFSDVAAGSWYYDAVTTLAGLGIASGYADGTFKPDEAITREDFAVMAVRFAGLAQKSGATGFTDVPETHKSAGYIKAAVEAGYIFGYGDGTFGPDRSITRAETVTIVNRMLNRYADKAYINANAGSLNPFTDVTKDHWAYYEILEAAITHNCIKDVKTENWTD